MFPIVVTNWPKAKPMKNDPAMREAEEKKQTTKSAGGFFPTGCLAAWAPPTYPIPEDLHSSLFSFIHQHGLRIHLQGVSCQFLV